MLPSGLMLLLVFLGGLCLSAEPDHWTEDNQEKQYCTWKCLIYTLQWPTGFCVSLQPSLHPGLQNQPQCVVPPSVHTWTIHGLWPQRAEMCCGCWPIFPSDLKELDPELSQLWPSLLKSVSNFAFWKEEWFKHGSCAACVEGMNSPLRYFQIALKLRARFHIDQLLDTAGIKPSCNQTYELAEILGVLAPVLGEQMVIQCVQDKGREVWFQTKILLSQNLTLGCDRTDCIQQQHKAQPPQPQASASPGHPCPEQVPLLYLPINHQHPQEPCD